MTDFFKKVKIKLNIEDAKSTLELLKGIPQEKYEIVDEGLCDVVITPRGISLLPDWDLVSLPFIYSQYLPINNNNLELVIDLRSENFDAINEENFPANTLYEKNYECIKGIINNKLVLANIYDDYIVNAQFEDYALVHNKAVLAHFYLNKLATDPEMVIDQFRHSTYLAPDAFWLAYTNFLFMILLLELNKIDEAITIANQIIRRDVPDKIKSITLMSIYKVLTMSESEQDMSAEIKQLESEMKVFLNQAEFAFNFYTSQSIYLEANQQLQEALNSLSKALENTEEKTYNHSQTHMAKANLLIKMAQMGDTHNYTFSLQTYYEALKFINKTDYPFDYANCQMNIGIIYAELPSVDHKKHIYAGLSQTAFTEALLIYNKRDRPYDYATVCTNFGNSMMRFLPYIDDDRFEKISHYFNEAIAMRQKLNLPEEQGISLLSLLNLYYYRIENVEEMEVKWLQPMEEIAQKILSLSTNPHIVSMANEALLFVNQKH